jgi:hypothetical protein
MSEKEPDLLEHLYLELGRLEYDIIYITSVLEESKRKKNGVISAIQDCLLKNIENSKIEQNETDLG